MGARFYADDAGVMLWRRDGIVGRLDLGVDTQWPVEQLTLRLEVESGTALNTVGEVIFLPVADWQRKRYCDYDAIRYDLGRLKDGEWAESQRRCQSLDEAVADASPELKAGATRTLKGGTQ